MVRGMPKTKPSVKSLAQNPKNPRVITDEKLDQLTRSMEAHGDISGVVFNRRTGHLVGGNQRSKGFDSSSHLVISKRFDPPTKKGTVAIGYVEQDGERFSYREVDWDENQETAAMIAANKNAGEWDDKALKEQLKNLASFDVDFDMELTMFDDGELMGFGVGENEEVEDEDEEKVKRGQNPSKMVHECPRCGHEFR